MSKNVGKILSDATLRAGFHTPKQFVGSNDQGAKRALLFLVDTIREIVQQVSVDGLVDFHAMWVFQLNTGEWSMPLPRDFAEFLPDQPSLTIMRASAEEWAQVLSGNPTTGQPCNYKLENGRILFDPVAKEGSLLTLRYVSRFSAVRAVDLYNDIILAQYPPKLKNSLVYRDGQDDVKDYGLAVNYHEDNPIWGEAEWDTSTWGPTFDQAMRRQGRYGGASVRLETFDDDSNLIALNDPYVAELGVTMKLLQSIGADYAEVAGQYEQEIYRLSAIGKGSTVSMGIGSSDYDEYYSPPSIRTR